MANNDTISVITLPNEVSYDIKDLYAVREPSAEGSNGQVLTTDGNGGRSWTTVGAGTETDPVFTASAAADITSSDITNWDAKAKIATATLGAQAGTWSLDSSTGEYTCSIPITLDYPTNVIATPDCSARSYMDVWVENQIYLKSFARYSTTMTRFTFMAKTEPADAMRATLLLIY